MQNSQVEEIKSKLDIVDLVQEYVPLKQSGANFKGLCPFHHEKTPSFMVSSERQIYKCFGCGEGGDILTFLQKIENVEFPEALRILAEKAGVKLQQQKQNPHLQNLKTRLFDLHENAILFFQKQLFSEAGKNALNYLQDRRALNTTIIQKFKIGLSPNSWNQTANYLKAKGFTDEELRKSGLVVEKQAQGYGSKYYDRFRGRIMFPIFDAHHNPVGFTARSLDPNESAKYINTPQTYIYNKSEILYGLNFAKKQIRDKGFLILVEGNMDVIASQQAGVENVVATSGTSLTEAQIRLVKRFTNKVAICFDADSAGATAAERSVKMFWQAGFDVKSITLPEPYKDPDELIKKNKEKWPEAINNKQNFFEYLIQQQTADKDLDNLDTKRAAAGKLLSWLAIIDDSIVRDYYLKQLTNLFNVDEESLRESLQKIIAQQKKPIRDQYQSFNKTEQSAKPLQDKSRLISERFLAFLIKKPQYLVQSLENIEAKHLHFDFVEFYKKLIIFYNQYKQAEQVDFEDFSHQFRHELQKTAKPMLFIFDSLKMLAENEFGDLTSSEVAKEYDYFIKFLRQENLSQQLRQIEKNIRLAEQQGDQQEADRLTQEFSLLSKQIKQL